MKKNQVGMQMAYLEMKMVLVLVLQKFKLQHNPKNEPIITFNITLSSQNGVSVLATNR